MSEKKLELFIDGRFDQKIEFTARKVINTGYSGRNQAEIKKHIDELKALGIPAPERTPLFLPKPAHLLSTTDSMEVIDHDNTGEAEAVLLVGKEEIYVAVGSDHSDRKLHAVNIPKSKQLYPNFISRAVWRLSDVEDHWDELMLRSSINGPEGRQVYQEGRLSALLRPRDVLAAINPLIGGYLSGLVIYLGTLATKGEIKFSDRFEAELVDEVRGQALYCGYSIELINWFHD